jgi:hypothetical protein
MNLSPELETRLASLAEAKGTSIEAFLRDIVDEKSGQASMRLVDPEEWAKEFEAWADSFPDTPPIPDEALTRDNLYPDRF